MHCIKCDKHRKFKNPKMSYIFDKSLALSIICDTCVSKDEMIYKEEASTEI